jgi:hypothetical protein
MRMVVLAAVTVAALATAPATLAQAGDPQPDNRGTSRQSQVQPGADQNAAQDAAQFPPGRAGQQPANTRQGPNDRNRPQPGASGAREGGASAPGTSSATTGTPPSGEAPPAYGDER